MHIASAKRTNEGRKFGIGLLLTLFLLSCACLTASAAMPLPEPHEDRHVLAILSYDPEFPTSQDILMGLTATFRGFHISLDVEYMDTKKVKTPESIARFDALLQTKMAAKRPYDVVMTFDDNALQFALERKNSLFAGLPLVFAGVNDTELARSLDAKPLVTGVTEVLSIQDTLQLIRVLHPEAKVLHVIVDNTETGQMDWLHLQQENKLFELQPLSFSDAAPEAFGLKLGEIPAGEPILLLSAYQSGDASNYTFAEALELILGAARSPVYHLWKHGVGEGLAGGKLVSQESQARSAAGMVLRILNGTDAAAIPVMMKSPNVALFDQRVLVKFGLDPTLLPPGTVFLNRKPHFREAYPDQYRNMLLGAFTLGFVILLLAAYLFYRIKTAGKLKSMLAFLQNMLDAMVDPVFVKDEEGRFLTLNRSMELLLGKTKEEIVGTHTDAYFYSKGFTSDVIRMDKEVMERGTSREMELDILREGRKRRMLLKKSMFLNQDDKPILVGTLNDVTDEREHEKQLEALNRKLESMVEERTCELTALNDELQKLSMTDQLTGLMNRRALDPILSDMHAAWKRKGKPYAVLLMDIDLFKRINDRKGHLEGDRILSELAALLMRHVRNDAYAGRWGGEEFLMLIPGVSLETGAAIAERLRVDVEDTVLMPDGKLTISIGVAGPNGDDMPENVVKRADEALYKAKRMGRNRVVAAKEA